MSFNIDSLFFFKYFPWVEFLGYRHLFQFLSRNIQGKLFSTYRNCIVLHLFININRVCQFEWKIFKWKKNFENIPINFLNKMWGDCLCCNSYMAYMGIELFCMNSLVLKFVLDSFYQYFDRKKINKIFLPIFIMIILIQWKYDTLARLPYMKWTWTIIQFINMNRIYKSLSWWKKQIHLKIKFLFHVWILEYID